MSQIFRQVSRVIFFRSPPVARGAELKHAHRTRVKIPGSGEPQCGGATRLRCPLVARLTLVRVHTELFFSSRCSSCNSLLMHQFATPVVHFGAVLCHPRRESPYGVINLNRVNRCSVYFNGGSPYPTLMSRCNIVITFPKVQTRRRANTSFNHFLFTASIRSPWN